MAMTPEEKARSKEARKVRDRAYRARYNARAAIEQAGLQAIDREFQQRIESAEAAEQAAMSDRAAALGDIDRQIRALQEKRKELEEHHNALCSSAREPGRQLWATKNAAKDALQKQLDAQFPDLVGQARWSAAIWGARQAASAKK